MGILFSYETATIIQEHLVKARCSFYCSALAQYPPIGKLLYPLKDI